MSQLGHERPIWGLRAMSAHPPIATKPLRYTNRRSGPIASLRTAEKQRDFFRQDVVLLQSFAGFDQAGVRALLVASDAVYSGNAKSLVTLADRRKLPAIYFVREFPAVGGLMSYGTSFDDAYRQAGGYVGRILKGEKPADLPVVQSAKFEFVINLKTAKALGITCPPGLLAIADEVIE